MLAAANQAWAAAAPVLGIACAATSFARNGKPNRHAAHDLGQALAQLTTEATSRGLAVHQMAGFDVEKARSEHAIPPGWEPVAAIAIGHPADPEALPDDARARENAARKRKSVRDFVFSGTWGVAC